MESIVTSAWTKERLQQLIDDKIEEGPRLDYKAAKFLDRNKGAIEAITKAVSAFANSAGGTVVFGISEFTDAERGHLPEKLDPIDGREFSREWIDQIIGQISPRIEGVRIEPVRIGPESWHVCYVVDIPQGSTAHQARDCRYYQRINFESVPMADPQIRDVMNRRSHPKLEFLVRLEQASAGKTKILARIWNKGSVLARHYEIKVWVPTIVNGTRLLEEGLIRQDIDGFRFWRLSLRGRIDLPLFPKSDAIREYEIANTYQSVPEPAANYLLCSLFADEMPCIERKVQVSAALADWA